MMKITLKLYANLSEYLPSHAQRNAVVWDLDEHTTIHELIDELHVPRTSAHLVLVNGVYIQPHERDQVGRLKEGDVLAIWPPVAGG